MKFTHLIFCGLLGICSVANAKVITVKEMKVTGPVTIQKPFMLDSVNAMQTPFRDAKVMYGDVYTARFNFSCDSWVNTEVKVDGAKLSTVTINGKEVCSKQGYQPGQYSVEVRYVKDTADVKVYIDTDKPIKTFVMKEGDKRPFNLLDNMLMSHYNGMTVSPSGKFAIVTSSHMNSSGGTEFNTRIINTQTGALIRLLDDSAPSTLSTGSGQTVQWMHKSDRYLITRNTSTPLTGPGTAATVAKRALYSVDPLTLSETLLNDNLPEGEFILTPDETALIMAQKNEGPKHEDGVYEVINMEDRQPGYRNRTQLIKYDLKTSMIQPLTFGNDRVNVVDVSKDSKELYFATKENIFSTERPTERVSLFRMNLTSLKTDTMLYREGFIDNIKIIPGTEVAIIMGCADAFKGIGRNLPADKIPNIWEHQLYLCDFGSSGSKDFKITTLTKDFDPSVNIVNVNVKDYVFFTAAVADSVALYRLSLKSQNIARIKQPVEVIDNCIISENGSTLLYYGSGACTPNRLYTMNTKALKPVMLDDLNKTELADVELGTCQPWRFKSKNGYELTGHVYLPAHFVHPTGSVTDSIKKYPMLVHYYGGCTATERLFGMGGRYPAHYWNALGYIVLVVNPSGAAGFGQEWGSRHVNTAGEGPAQDIIEATKWYCDNNSFVDTKAIGCISASYGGFMTQWILTKTDMFAAGVSHAGISDHTSYWGNGYWGYSYSEVAMANSFPWTRKDIYVDRSPLYNADKIHTPLLFTHGTADTNVPVMESIQMYTALKLLQRPTALILVEGQNHWIMEYTKKQKWINTYMAWFQKYLKHDDSWWNALYSPKDL